MTGRQWAGAAMLAVVAILLVGAIILAAEPWWAGLVVIAVSIALAAVTLGGFTLLFVPRR